ncbi:MAG: glycosyltransferase [Anaerolineae bacterium]|nr:glycosyltransferase [Anaerolineae bacterium]
MYRVLFVDHAQALGGAEYSLLLLFEHLNREQFEPFLVCNPSPLAERARQLGVQVIEITMPRLRKNVLAPALLGRGAYRLAKVIREKRIDLVQSNVMRASFYAALAAWLTGVPLLWHVRDLYTPGVYVSWMARVARAAVAISRAVKEPLPATLPCYVIPNGVDLSLFRVPKTESETLRRSWGVPEDGALVGFLGRLRKWKGPEDFIRAMALVQARYPAARFVLVGGTVFANGGDYEEELKTLARGLGLGDKLFFAGYRRDVPQVLAALDLLVHCSVVPEPFGRVIIEAMAAGLPVVAYNHGGPSEIILHQETGLLVPPRDVRSLAEAVGLLLGRPEWARALGRAGRRRVEQCYEIRALTRRLEEVFVQVIEAERESR